MGGVTEVNMNGGRVDAEVNIEFFVRAENFL